MIAKPRAAVGAYFFFAGGGAGAGAFVCVESQVGLSATIFFKTFSFSRPSFALASFAFSFVIFSLRCRRRLSSIWRSDMGVVISFFRMVSSLSRERLACGRDAAFHGA